MARKGQFKKGGGRVGTASRSHGGGGGRKRRASSGRSTAIVVVPSAAPARRRQKSLARHHHKKPHKRRHHRGGGHGGVTTAKLVGTAIVLANVAGTNSGPLGAKVYDLVQKIPGAKTFGGAATAGLVLGATYKYTKIGGRFRPLMACAGIIGLVAAALKIGEQGTSFKWLGGDSGDYLDVQQG